MSTDVVQPRMRTFLQALASCRLQRHMLCSRNLQPAAWMVPPEAARIDCVMGGQVLDGNLSPKEAVFEIMNLPQIEER